MKANRHVNGNDRRQQHEGEDDHGSQMSHRLIPLFIHSRTSLVGI
jgi:hypothetical protein